MNEDIGKKVKQLRTQQKMTLKEVSERTRLSTGFLSQLERGLTSIATDSLAQIAALFGVDLSYFFTPKQNSRGFILRSYERSVSQIENSRFIHYHLSGQLATKNLLPRIIDLLPINSDENISQYQHEGEEFIYVLEGTLTLLINNEQHELFPGDSAHYPSSVVHNWANYTNKMVKLLAVNTPNPF